MIKIYVFGKPKQLTIHIGEYINRISRNLKGKFEIIYLKDINPEKLINISQIAHIKGEVYILSEYGKVMDTMSFINFSKGKYEQSIDIVYIIGNANGWEKEVYDKYKSISLSMMTYSHEIALLLLVEQIYRFSDHIVGGKYNKI